MSWAQYTLVQIFFWGIEPLLHVVSISHVLIPKDEIRFGPLPSDQTHESVLVSSALKLISELWFRPAFLEGKETIQCEEKSVGHIDLLTRGELRGFEVHLAE